MITPEATRHHDEVDAHRRTPWLADAVLGGQDGVVNVLGVILGIAAATSSTRVVLVGGLAASLAEAVSMAAVAYTSTRAASAHFQAEREREYRHVRDVPAIEREELRAIYRKKGFDGPLLDRIVETITRDPDVWVAVMMAEEHGLSDVDVRGSLRSAAIVGAFSLLGLVPLVPFLVASTRVASIASVVVAAILLFFLGALKARLTVGRPWKSGLELAVIGTIAALVGYAVGALVPVG